MTLKFDLKTHLTALSETHAPSGYEDQARAVVAAAWHPLVDRMDTGRMGSLVGYKYGEMPAPRRRIMLSAHIDEIGMIVTKIEKGFLKVARLGGTDWRTILGLPVRVHTQSGPLLGVVGTYPLFDLNGGAASTFPTEAAIFIDVGLPAEEAAAKVRVGDIVTMDAPVFPLAGEKLAGKAFDDRASVAAVTACLNYLQGRRHQWDVLAVATVQEETGLAGALNEAYRLQPDLAIAIDVGFAAQPGVQSNFQPGKGPVLSLGANFHPALCNQILEAAKRIEMTLDLEPVPANSGTDAWAIQISREGIPSALLNLIIRNMHSTVETLDLRDVDRCGRLMAEFIAGLDANTMQSIVWE